MRRVEIDAVSVRETQFHATALVLPGLVPGIQERGRDQGPLTHSLDSEVQRSGRPEQVRARRSLERRQGRNQARSSAKRCAALRSRPSALAAEPQRS